VYCCPDVHAGVVLKVFSFNTWLERCSERGIGGVLFSMRFVDCPKTG